MGDHDRLQRPAAGRRVLVERPRLPGDRARRGPPRPPRLQPLDPAGPFVNFQPVDEPEAGKARIHLDVLVDDIDTGVERVLELGGIDTGAREALPRGRIAVMRDPEGNEFCLLAPPS